MSQSYPAVEDFDLQHYMGKWYEIGRFDHYFERGLDNVYAVYSLRQDGVSVVNSGREIKSGEWKNIEGVARLTEDAAGKGELEVSFFRPFWSDYRVIKLSDDYSLAAVVGGSADYFWLLSRSPEPAADKIAAFVDELEVLGIDTAQILWIDQDENRRSYDDISSQ